VSPFIAACAPGEPDIVRVSPAKGDVGVSPTAPIAVTFDRAMDRGSVEQRLEVDPAIPGCRPARCETAWSGNTLTLQHAGHPFFPATNYKVLLRRGYRDTHGQVDSFDHAWDFTTESAPALTSTAPSDGAAAVGVDADIVLQFSRAVLAPPESAVALDPSTPFNVRLDPTDASRLVVAPLRLLRPATAYHVTVAGSLADTHGGTLGHPRTFEFTTGRLNLGRTLAFATGTGEVEGATRLVDLRPPATLQSRPPTLRVLYDSAAPIADFGWTASGQGMWVLKGPSPGPLVLAGLAGGADTQVAAAARYMAPSPAADEVAFVDDGGRLHLANGVTDVTVAAVGTVLEPPAWSADGGRLALVAGAPASPSLVVLDRRTLASYRVAEAAPCTPCAPPAWAFDGSAVAFSGRAGASDGLLVYRPANPAASAVALLSAARPAGLAWSADASQVYAVTTAGISAVDSHPLAAGALPSPLPASRPGDSSPTVTAYDRRVAFLRPSGGVAQLWLMNSDGTGQRALTAAGYDRSARLVDFPAAMPRWAPAGT